MSKNSNLHQAKIKRNDEFYTQLSDVEKELNNYISFFENKTIYCNCDNPGISNFYKYFKINFRNLKLKKVIATCYNKNEKGIISTFEGIIENKTYLKGDGNFKSQECLKLLKESNLIITNPPFSLFKEYLNLLIENNCNFIIVGNKNMSVAKNIFPLFKNNKIRFGYNNITSFITPDNTIKKFGNIGWFTNLPVDKQNQIKFTKNYFDNKNDFPFFMGTKIINVNKISDIPNNYNGIMGVPISYLECHNPNLFEIIATSTDNGWLEENNIKPLGENNIKRFREQGNKTHLSKGMRALIYEKDNKLFQPYKRILIKRKNLNT